MHHNGLGAEREARIVTDELLVARNPDSGSRLGYLLRLPLAGGMVFRTSGTWPRTTALYCYPVTLEEWPDEPEIVESAPIRSCAHHGAGDRPGPRPRPGEPLPGRVHHRPAARPNITTPTARAAGIAELQIAVDTRERYAHAPVGPSREQA